MSPLNTWPLGRDITTAVDNALLGGNRSLPKRADWFDNDFASEIKTFSQTLFDVSELKQMNNPSKAIRDHVYGPDGTSGSVPMILTALKPVMETADDTTTKALRLHEALAKPLNLSWIDTSSSWEGVPAQQVLDAINTQAQKGSFDLAQLGAGLVVLRHLRKETEELLGSVKNMISGDLSQTPNSARVNIRQIYDALESLTNDKSTSEALRSYSQCAVKGWQGFMSTRHALERNMEAMRRDMQKFNEQLGDITLAQVDGGSPPSIKEKHRHDDLFPNVLNTNYLKMHVQWLRDNLVSQKGGVLEMIRSTPPARVLGSGELEILDRRLDENFWAQVPSTSTYMKDNRKAEYELWMVYSKMTAIMKALRIQWNQEDIGNEMIQAISSLFNTYTSTVSSLRLARQGVATMASALDRLDNIVTNLLCTIKDLQADLMSGEAYEVRLDYRRMGQAFDELKTWSTESRALHIEGLDDPRPESGYTFYKDGKTLEGRSAPSRNDYDVMSGMVHLDISAAENLRIETISDDSGPSPHLRVWADTRMYQAYCNWIAVPRGQNKLLLSAPRGAEESRPLLTTTGPRRLLDFGETPMNAFQPYEWRKYRCAVDFSPDFAAEYSGDNESDDDDDQQLPSAICWLTRMDFGSGRRVKADVKVVGTTPRGLEFELEIGDDSVLYDVRVGWAAFHKVAAGPGNKSSKSPHPAPQLKVFAASAEVGHNGPGGGHSTSTAGGGIGGAAARLNTPFPGHYFRFPEGLFEREPAIMYGLQHVSLAKENEWHRVWLESRGATRDGVWVSGNTKWETQVDACGAVVLAIGY